MRSCSSLVKQNTPDITECERQTDRRMDGRTDERTSLPIDTARLSIAVARKKTENKKIQ